MATYFHVDRGMVLMAGQQIDSRKPDLATVPDLAEHFDDLFPNGISAHGDLYLASDVKSGSGDAALELIWEYVRRAYFPHRCSRFSAIYAWVTLQDAKAFRVRSGIGSARIWQVEADDGFVANMSLLNIGTTVLRASQFAHAYWSGQVGPKLEGLLAPCWEVLLRGPIRVIEQVSDT